MRAKVLEIMESYPVVLRLRLADGAVRDFDTAEDCLARARGRPISMNELNNAVVDIVLRDGRIHEIDVVQER